MLLLPQLGFALFFVTNVSASMITSVIVDHTGFMGTPQKRVGRWSGAGIVIVSCYGRAIAKRMKSVFAPTQVGAGECARGLAPSQFLTPRRLCLCRCCTGVPP